MASFIIKTFGCKTNQTESAVMEEKLLTAGFINAENIENCDYYIFNSCSVTQEADKKLLSAIKSVKNKKPDIKILLTGCYAQLNPSADNPYVDFVFGIYEKSDVVEIITNNETKKISDINSHKDFRYEKLSSYKRTRAAIKIQDGCNNRCSYCTICIARGLSRSCKTEYIIEQINVLVQEGFNEVILTGIHVGQWGEDLEPKQTLIDLLKEIEKTDIKTIRIGSLDPNETTDELIDFISKSEKICPHFHLSLQSLCNKTLKNMNRHYDFEKIAKVFYKIQNSFDNIFLGCDIIVGFPMETEEDFEITYERLKILPLSQIHVFPYSIRKNTIAEKMPEQISTKEKHGRISLVKELSEKKHLEFLKSNIGKEFFVTVEKNSDKKTGLYKAVTPNYIKVLFKARQTDKNQLIKIKLTEIHSDNTSMIGEKV